MADLWRWLSVFVGLYVFTPVFADEYGYHNYDDEDNPINVYLTSVPLGFLEWDLSQFCAVEVFVEQRIGEEGEFYYLNEGPYIRGASSELAVSGSIGRIYRRFYCKVADLGNLSIETNFRRVLNGKTRRVSLSLDGFNEKIIWRPIVAHLVEPYSIISKEALERRRSEREQKRRLAEEEFEKRIMSEYNLSCLLDQMRRCLAVHQTL